MLSVIDSDYVNKCLPEIKETAHKGDCGCLGVLAGSFGMAGAAALSISSAYRCGAGLVYGFIPKSIYGVLAVLCPNAVFYPSEDYCEWDLNRIKNLDALVIGCGLGNNDYTAKAVEYFVDSNIPFVLDADGINVLAGRINYIKGKKAVITPHVGEASRILGCSAADIENDRALAVKKLAELSGAVAVLKGHNTLICDGKQTFVCKRGNNGMATAGSGDVLAGIIGAFLAQGCLPVEAACLGVYIHALAGDTAADKLSRRGMCAMDIVTAVPEIFKSFEG